LNGIQLFLPEVLVICLNKEYLLITGLTGKKIAGKNLQGGGASCEAC